MASNQVLPALAIESSATFILPPPSRSENVVANNEQETTPATNEVQSVPPVLVADIPTSKREDFEQFLTQGGIKYGVIRAIVTLYEEKDKPDDPLGYIASFLGKGIPTEQEIKEINATIEKLRQQCDVLMDENFQLKLQLGLVGGEDDDWKYECFHFSDEEEEEEEEIEKVPECPCPNLSYY